MTDREILADARGDQIGSIDDHHLLLVGAGPGLGLAVARRFAQGGYRVTLVAKSPDTLRSLVESLGDTGAEIGTLECDIGDSEWFGVRIAELYAADGAPGVVIYNAVVGAPDQLMTSNPAHLAMTYAVDVIGAIVVAQNAVPAMRASGGGTILFTSGGFADHPVSALATVSLGKAALRSAATMLESDLRGDGIRVAALTILGQIVPGTPFDPANIANRYWEVVRSHAPWQPEYRFSGEEST